MAERRAGAGEGPDASADGKALDESEQPASDNAPSDTPNQPADPATPSPGEEEAAKLGDFA